MKCFLKKKVVAVVCLLVLIVLFFCFLSWSVYGNVDFVQSIRSDFMKNVVVPIGGGTIGLVGIWYGIRSNINLVNKNDTIKREEERTKKNETSYQNLIFSFEELVKTDNRFEYYETWFVDEATKEEKLGWTQVEFVRNAIFSDSSLNDWTNIIVSVFSVDEYKKWLLFRSLLDENIKYSSVRDSGIDLSMQLGSIVSYYEENFEYNVKDFSVEDKVAYDEVSKEMDQNGKDRAFFDKKYKNIESLEKMVVISLLDLIYALRKKIDGIQISFEEFVRVSKKSIEINNDDLINFSDYKESN